MKALQVDKNLVQALFMAGLKTDAISRQTGVPRNTLHTWSHRYGWNEALSKVKGRVEIAVTDASNQSSLALRETFANTLTKHAQALEKVPAKPNLKHIRAVGEALEPLTRSAKTVFGWGDEKQTGLMLMGTMKQLEQKPIDVESSTLPVVDEAKPALPDS